MSSISQAPAGKKAIPTSQTPPSRPPEKTPKAVDSPKRDKQSKSTQDRVKKPGNPGQRQAPEPIDIGMNANVGEAALGVPPETMVTEDE